MDGDAPQPGDGHGGDDPAANEQDGEDDDAEGDGEQGNGEGKDVAARTTVATHAATAGRTRRDELDRSAQ